MSRRLYVANLDGSVEEEDLKLLFARCGVVRAAQVVRSPATNDSTGMALVEVSLEREGAAAIALLHGREYRGRELIVQWATFRHESDANHAAMSPGLTIGVLSAEGREPRSTACRASRKSKSRKVTSRKD
jgi:nucleolysin TIA-1/TIAR